MVAMRIYLPMSAEDRTILENSPSGHELHAGRAAWGVTGPASADNPDHDDEDLEYEAMQDAMHVALLSADATSRALVIAVDVPEGTVAAAEESGGAFGVELRETARVRIASFHVSELDAVAAQQDDTDPALLWFDASEVTDAFAYLDGAAESEPTPPSTSA